MSIKKLGGAKLRLVIGLAAALAVVAAFSATKKDNPFVSFASPTVVGGESSATLIATGLDDTKTYYIVSTGDDLGWVFDGANNTSMPYHFDDDYSPPAIEVVHPTDGEFAISIETLQVLAEQEAQVELREGNPSSGALVGDPADILVLTQD